MREALASVASQSLDSFELVVNDDASSDDSVEVINRALADLGLEARTVFHDSRRGICATFNEALDLIRTPFVAFLAADDVMGPDRLAAQLAALDTAPDAAVAYSDMWVIGEDSPARVTYSSLWGEDWRGGRHEDLFRCLCELNWIPAPSVLSRTDALREAGGYDENLSSEDHDMWLRLARRHAFVYVDRPLVTWRRVASSLTSRLDEHTDLQRGVERLHMLRKHLGQESDIDVWLEPIVFHLAVDQLKSGNGSPQVRHALRQCLRISPGRSRLRHATAAHLRAIGRRRVG